MMIPEREPDEKDAPGRGADQAEDGRPEGSSGTARPSDGEIVRAAIHPAIGVARVGNSADGYFHGPAGHRALAGGAGRIP